MTIKKRKDEQLEMFTPDEMNGGVRSCDGEDEDIVAAYLKSMLLVVELDENACHQIKRDCEDLKYSLTNLYWIPTLSTSVNSIELTTLTDIINMRIFALRNQGFDNCEDKSWLPQVTSLSDYQEAREVFMEKYSAKYNGTAWLIDLTDGRI